MSLNGETIVFRATPSAYIVFGAIFGFMTLMAGLAANADTRMCTPLLVCIVAWMFSYLWLSCFRLQISAESISYRTLFGGTPMFRFTQIQSIERQSGVRQYSDRFKPFVRLVIKSAQGTNVRPLYVNLKVFSAPAVRELIQALRVNFGAIGRPEVVRHL